MGESNEVSDRYVPVAERCERQASLLKDEGRDEAATVLWEADARIRELEAEAAHFRQCIEDYRYGSREADRQIAMLLGEVRRLSAPIEHMRHIKTHTYYCVLARGVRMQCAFPVSEGGEITFYRGADGTLFARPDGEFWDGVRFVPSDTPFNSENA